jgi:hypothetical protein
MNTYTNLLAERLGNFKVMTTPWGSFNVFNSKQIIGAKYLITQSLSKYQMPVHEKHKGEEFNELYFLLPSYWDIEELSNEKFNWVFNWLNKLQIYVEEKKTWFGHGHTIPCGSPFQSLSSSMHQNHFMLTRPIAADEDLTSISSKDKTIGFLGIIPIFEDEMDFKQGKGTAKLLSKFASMDVTEKLDDFRSTSLKKKWRFFRR